MNIVETFRCLLFFVCKDKAVLLIENDLKDTFCIVNVVLT